MIPWTFRTAHAGLHCSVAESTGGYGSPARRHPLGFSDVRGLPSAAGTARARVAPGFVSQPELLTGEPLYRTEVSFRRDGRSDPFVRAEALPSGGYGQTEPTVGHAASWPGESVDPSPVEEMVAEGAPDEAETVAEAEPSPVVEEPTGESATQESDEKVSFLKREITFGRRSRRDTREEASSGDVPAPGAKSVETPASVPFFKREIGFGRRKHATPATEGFEEESVDAAAEGQVDLPELHALEQPEPTSIVADESAEVAPFAESIVDDHETPRSETDGEPHVSDDAIIAEDETTAIEEAEWEPVEVEAVEEDLQPVSESDHADAPVEAVPPPADVTSKSDRKSVRPMRTTQRGSRRGGRGGGSSKGRPFVGLKIGASQIAAAVVAEHDGRHELIALARRPLDPGIVSGGEVRDRAALVRELRALFDEHRLPRRDVRIGIASNRIGVRTVEIVGIEDETRFDNAVRFKAHEVLPVAVHESLLDYRVVDERVHESGEAARRVLLVVAPRDQVQPFVDVCHDAGLKLVAVDLEALGLLRTFVDPVAPGVRPADDTATVVVSIGHESTTLLVAGAGACEFTRVFDWGGASLQEAIAAELAVSPVEAANILRHLSLGGPGHELPSLDHEARARAVDAVRGRLTPFARELVSSLQFYQTQPHSLGIGEIVITGGTSHLDGLADSLHQMIGVAVRMGDPLGRVVTRGSLDAAVESRLGSLAVAIGLAIDDDPSRTVNVMPKELLAPARKRPSLLAIGAPIAVAAPVAALAVLFLQASGQVDDRRGQLQTVRDQIAALPKPSGPTLDAGIVGIQAERALALSTVLGARFAWDDVLGDISRVLPSNVWLRQLKAKAPDPALTAAAPTGIQAGAAPLAGPPTGFTIVGYTFSQPDVAVLLSRLARVPGLTNVTLQSSAKEKLGKKTVISFTVLADLTNTGGTR
jgi:type IV pilus assembly protein PilM